MPLVTMSDVSVVRTSQMIKLTIICSAVALGMCADSQSLVEDEVERILNGVKNRKILHSYSLTLNFNVSFCLYSSYNTTCGLVNATGESIRESSFDPSLRTKVIIHGYRPFVDDLPAWVPKLTNQILKFDAVNVIAVNWLDGVRTDYEHAKRNVPRAAELVAGFLNAILDEFDLYDPRDMHVIGFSLGAQVSGFTGKIMRRQRNVRLLGRITGLDPAGPGFNVESPNLRLDKSDAMFVDVIHTDATADYDFELGLNRNVGHIDFYPNGGSNQAGCSKWKDIKLGDSLMGDMVRYVSCDHTRAVSFFMHSVNNTMHRAFEAFRCSNFDRFQDGKCFGCGKRVASCSTPMGYWLRKQDVRKQGSYYLLTTAEHPYCGLHYKLEIQWSSSGRTDSGSLLSFGQRLHKYGNSGATQVYVTAILVGESGGVSDIALDRGNLVSARPGETSTHVFVAPWGEAIGDIVLMEFRLQGDWISRFLREDLRVERARIFDVKARNTYISRSIRSDDVGDTQSVSLRMRRQHRRRRD